MENRKSQIIELTLRNISERGYLSFSYDDLAKELNVTKASIHYHFMKKEDLGLAVCTKIKDGLETTYNSVCQLDVTPEEKLWAFIFRRTEKIGNNEICPLSSLQADYNYIPDSMQEAVHGLSEMEIRYTQNLLEDIYGERKGTAFQDTHAIAALMIASVKGALQYRRVLGSEFLLTVSTQLKKMLDMQR
ncbi:TetR/AcrR family transcriptional regulator [Sporosarcina sp. BI001-red]|uniref:TetR/AcrR family transcriptional regulator n=1 Tax=Sporosarcina sp. BI001-red TaxID=2282866 RepID=UPI000E26F208|nr:TetR/AcrR family transcriptional regulator [Sporosarcina sp. BI001-red]REB06108.1 TetR/AcrR family transcriptional regulator [Sporosarcina sp. BI001-red]